MNEAIKRLQAERRMTLDAFLAFEDTLADGERAEWTEGEAFMMAGGKAAHGRATVRLSARVYR